MKREQPRILPIRLVIPLLLSVIAVYPLSIGASDQDSFSVESKLRDLERVLSDSGPNEWIPITIVLEEQTPADLINAAKASPDKAVRRAVTTDLLKATARSTQGPLLELLEREQAAGRVGPRVTPLWIVNVIIAEVTPSMAHELAARNDVAYLNHDEKRDDVLIGDGSGAVTGGTNTCGVELVRADEVWSTYGITGDGAVIAVIDTGICHTHPDLANQIWVNPGEDLDSDGVVFDPDDVNGVDDDGNGFVDDFIGWDFQANDNSPEDTNSHGTHVSGTIAGDGTNGEQTGVAPGAKLMMLEFFNSFAGESTVWNAMQYAADNAADAVSASIGWPHSVSPDRVMWRMVCENTNAAGTLPIYAAGNEGNCCGPTDNVRTPGDVPIVLTVGAVECDDDLASFSSIGPVTWTGVPGYDDFPFPPGLMKPTVSAPGVDTISTSFDCNGYLTFNGTSMATPHVAGLAALMLEANPFLTPEVLKDLIRTTATDLGDAGPDNSFGDGRIDAVAAVEAALAASPPTITDVSPDQGFIEADTPVIITGINLGAVVTVEFGDIEATGLTVVNDTTITATAPANVVLGDVKVTASGPVGEGSLAGGFTYLPNITVTPTSASPGDEITVNVTGPPDGEWAVLRDTVLGDALFKGFELCVERSSDFKLIDHTRRTLPLLDSNYMGSLTFTIPFSIDPGDTMYVQVLYDGNGPQPSIPIYGGNCEEVDIVP